MSPFLLHNRMLTGPILCKSHASYHSYFELKSEMALSCPEHMGLHSAPFSTWHPQRHKVHLHIPKQIDLREGIVPFHRETSFYNKKRKDGFWSEEHARVPSTTKKCTLETIKLSHESTQNILAEVRPSTQMLTI